MNLHLRVGTRASRLAMAQTNQVIDLLKNVSVGISWEIVPISTEGDLDTASPIDKMSAPGVFTGNIERQLIAGKIDMAVHSAKDLPSREHPEVVIAAIPPRDNCEDVLISKSGLTLENLPKFSGIGTGSVRRRAMLLNRRPDLSIERMRGNVETRLRKFHDSHLQAIVLSRIGLERLGLEKSITQILDPRWFVPAAGQGALAVQVRRQDDRLRELLSAIDDPVSRRSYSLEKGVLGMLSAGCDAAIGVYARPVGGEWVVTIAALDRNGGKRIELEEKAPIDTPESVLLDRISAELIANDVKSLLGAADE